MDAYCHFPLFQGYLTDLPVKFFNLFALLHLILQRCS
jgi:hypothetical protein